MRAGRWRFGAALAALCLIVAAALHLMLRAPERLPPTGLFTSLPIVWGEGGDVLDGLKPGAAPPHWVRAWLQARSQRWRALDYLAPAPADLGLLILAQPRPLSPEENVALDGWLRGGGRVLLFADPALTQESAFALGDPRRSQDAVMLSPILARWNLRLEYDARQPALLRWTAPLGAEMPVAMAGRLVRIDPGGACAVLAGGLIADCRVGQGRAVIVADAALLEAGDEDDQPARAEALEALVARLRR